MEYTTYIFTFAVIADYLATAIGVFLILRRRTRLGYALLLGGFLLNIVPTFVEGLVPAGIDLTVEAALFISLVAWFASKYELVKRSKTQAKTS